MQVSLGAACVRAQSPKAGETQSREPCPTDDRCSSPTESSSIDQSCLSTYSPCHHASCHRVCVCVCRQCVVLDSSVDQTGGDERPPTTLGKDPVLPGILLYLFINILIPFLINSLISLHGQIGYNKHLLSLTLLSGVLLAGSCRSWNWWFGRLTPRRLDLAAICFLHWQVYFGGSLLWPLDDTSDTDRSTITSSFGTRKFLPFFFPFP